MNQTQLHPSIAGSIAGGRFAVWHARGRGSLGFAGFGRGGLTPGTAHGPAQELRLLVRDLREALAAACRCGCIGYRGGDRRYCLLHKRCSWRRDRLVSAFGYDRRAFGELAALDGGWPWHALLAIAAVVTLLTLWTIRTAFTPGMPVLAWLITLLGPLILALPVPFAARIGTALTAWLAPVLVAILVAVWAAVFTTIRAPILIEALFARALTEVAIAIAIAMLALLIALILALAVLAVAALAVFALIALAVVLLTRAAVHAALRGIVHPRLLLGALHRAGADIRTAVLIVVAHIAALLERLSALAAELARIIHAAGRGFATLLHLLFAIGKDDAIIVFGVLQIVLGQHWVAGGQCIPCQRHVFLSNLRRRAMDLLVGTVRLIGAHQRIVMMLPLTVLMAAIVVVVVIAATATTAVLLSLPHGTFFSRANSLKSNGTIAFPRRLSLEDQRQSA